MRTTNNMGVVVSVHSGRTHPAATIPQKQRLNLRGNEVLKLVT
jgi:hypothetical protein